MNSRSERRLDQLEAQHQHQAVMSVENQRFELLPADFSEDEWEILRAVVWRTNADDEAPHAGLVTMAPHELALWSRATSIVCNGVEVPTAPGGAANGAGIPPEGADRARFSPSERRGRSPVLIVTAEQDDRLRGGTQASPSYVRVLILDNGREAHRHLRRELERLVCRW